VLQLVSDNPWLVPVALGMLIPICGIIFGTFTNYRIKVRQAELQAGLIQEMLQRGMSAEDIRTILEAAPKTGARRCRTDSARVREWPAQS